MKPISKNFPIAEAGNIQYPTIALLPEGTTRPFWSVMIPTYNGTKYLEQTLRSLLDQDPGSEYMQIEVIDDCSTKDDPEELVRQIGQNRISFFRQPKNGGLCNSWNTCIQRAKGHWIHILHQDDLVLPGFYSTLQKSLAEEQSVGAAFCRHAFIDSDSHWQLLSRIESKTPGILTNWIEQIAVRQLIQCPAIVVKRSVYEKLGGFLPELPCALDWEMWRRIAAHYPVWYEPQILACYRLHSASEFARLSKTGEDTADTRKSIEIAAKYLPDGTSDRLSKKAREFYAFDALSKAWRMLKVGETKAATAQIREALRCSHSLKVVLSALKCLVSVKICQVRQILGMSLLHPQT
ncbi:glycosyltransferase [Scytonema tolypothrichoides VB-61278]|nr:glycosyltransferase [Scytonema tolypothrichoides VB-61278]